MQASVHQFEPDGSGTVLLDSGIVAPFTVEVFAASGLRLLRVGQRLSIDIGTSRQKTESDDGRSGAAVVSRLWIVGIGDNEGIR